jgi:1,4-alpha-glucan branching enzyme
MLNNKLKAAVFSTAFIAFSTLTPGIASAAAWLDDDPNAIWERAPGFYKEGNHWYAIIHTAPDVTGVKIKGDFTNGDAGAVSLIQTPDGKFWWFKGTDSSFPEAPEHGDNYRFILEEGETSRETQDPAARWVTHSGLDSGWSRVQISDAFEWTATDWQRPAWNHYNIYQLHPLRFTDRNGGTPFEEVIEELDNDGTNDYINDLGVTALELLPVNEFPGPWSWGYNPSFFYAIEESYGGSDQLKKLVDTAHKNGIAVILDLEYNHLGTGDNVLWTVNNETYADGDTSWGPLYNFDNDVAKHFLIQNILYLAKEYKIDGFRFDHTNTIHNGGSWFITKGATDDADGDGDAQGGWKFMREMYGAVKQLDPAIWLTGEELPDWWTLTAEDVGSEVAGTRHGPMDSQWTDTFHDNFKEALTGGSLEALWPVFGHFGDSWQDATVYTESHDEVGNTDDRIAKRARDGKGWEMNQVALAGTVMARGIPMAFMGQEGGESTQFHIDWWDDRLDLDDYTANPGRAKINAWYRKLNDIRKADKAALAQGDSFITHLHDQNGVVAFTRADGKYLIVLNFRWHTWHDYDVGVSGRYRELANTSWPSFNIGGVPFASRGGENAHDINNVHIPAYGAVILMRDDTPVNELPVAIAGADQTVTVGATIQLNGSQSHDPDGSITSYDWNGGLDDVANPSITLNEAGSYTYTLTVTDNAGATATDQVTITVEEASASVSMNFSCANGHTVWGQSVYIVGVLPELGSWNPASAIKLSPSNYPVWSGTVDNLPANTDFEWKCIKKGVYDVQWQNGGNNAGSTPASGTGATSGSF